MKVRMFIYENGELAYTSGWMDAETLTIKEITDYVKSKKLEVEYEYKRK